MAGRSQGKSRDFRAAEASSRRRKSFAPFAARVLAITLVRDRMHLSTPVIARILTDVLGVHTDERTVRNYLTLKTRADAQLVPNDFDTRFRRARLRPVTRTYSVELGDDALLRLLRRLQHEAMRCEECQRIAEDVMREIDYVNVGGEGWYSTNWKPMDETQAGDFGYDGEDGRGVLRQIIRRDSFIDDENLAVWWGRFESGRSDWIPAWVMKELAGTGRRRRSNYASTGTPVTVADFIDFGKKRKAQRRERRRMTLPQLLRDFDRAKSQGCSSASYFEKNKHRMPEQVRSLRTFQRRYAEWRKVQADASAA